MSSLTAYDLERLRWKYRLLTWLRARREEMEASGRSSFDRSEAAERRRLFRRLAREFPGALRELECLSASQLQARAERVEEALRGLVREGAAWRPDPWLSLIFDFHRCLREALMVKRWLARRLPREEGIPAAVVDEFIERVERSQRLQGGRGGSRRRPAGPGEALAFLSRHQRPPGGSVLRLVGEDLARRHGKVWPQLEPMIFGAIG